MKQCSVYSSALYKVVYYAHQCFIYSIALYTAVHWTMQCPIYIIMIYIGLYYIQQFIAQNGKLYTVVYCTQQYTLYSLIQYTQQFTIFIGYCVQEALPNDSDNYYYPNYSFLWVLTLKVYTKICGLKSYQTTNLCFYNKPMAEESYFNCVQ